MPKLCQHKKATETAIGAIPGAVKWVKKCDECWDVVGTCPFCKELVTIDAEGYIGFHNYPKPTRQVCPGAKFSSVEDVEQAGRTL